MMDRIRKLAARVDGLSLRERALIMLMVLAVVTALWYELLMVPVVDRHAELSKTVSVLQGRIDELNQAITRMVSGNQGAGLTARRAQLEEELARVEDQLRERTGNLVAPGEMAALLEEMLQRIPGLKLVEMRNLPPEPLLPGQAGAAVYRHGLAVTVEGPYAALLDYVKALEGLSWRFYWDRLALETERYPVNRTTIVVYTLSLEEGLLGV